MIPPIVIRVAQGLESIPATIGPRTGHQSVAGPTQRNRQTFADS